MIQNALDAHRETSLTVGPAGDGRHRFERIGWQFR